MLELIVFALTIAVLAVYGWALRELWHAGYWIIVMLAGPVTILVAYVLSSQQDRDDFRKEWRDRFRFFNRRK